MPISPVLPSLIGQPRNAQRTDRPVRMPNPLAGAAEGLSALGDAGMRIAGELARLRDEENELRLRETLNSAIAEADKRMDEEVFSQKGFGAVGSLDRTDKIYGEVMEKHMPNLNGKHARRFAEAFQSRRISQARYVMGRERAEVSGARVEANNGIIKSEGERYRASLDPAAIDNIRQAWEDNIRITQGRVITPASYAEFEADINDGDGFVKLPGGRKLRIGETDGSGVISRARVNRLKEEFKKQAQAYETGWKSICGSVHGGVIDLYLKDGRVDEAKRYLEEVRNSANPVSEAVAKEAERLIGLKKESIDLTRGAQAYISKLTGTSGYLSSASEGRCLAHLQELEEKAANDPTGKAQKALDTFRQVFASSRAAARMKLAADTRAVVNSLRENGDLSTAAGVADVGIKLMKADPELRRAVLHELAPVIMKLSGSKASKEASEARTGYLAACWARGCIYDKDGNAVPLGSGQQAKQAFSDFCAANGVTPAEAETVIRSTEKGKLPYMEASTDVSKFLNDILGNKVTDPDALNGLEAQAKFGPLIQQYNKLLLRYGEKGKDIPETVRRGLFFEMLRNQVRDGKPLADWVVSNIKKLRRGDLSLSEFYRRTASEDEMKAWNRALEGVNRSAAGVPVVIGFDDTAQASAFTGDVRDPETNEYIQPDELKTRTEQRAKEEKMRQEKDEENVRWSSPSYRVIRMGGLW